MYVQPPLLLMHLMEETEMSHHGQRYQSVLQQQQQGQGQGHHK